MQPSQPDSWQKRIRQLFDQMQRTGISYSEIFGLLYNDLKSLARHQLNGRNAGDSMCGTRLVNDLYVKLFDKPAARFEWESGAHFYNAMARAMHNLLVDYVRDKKKKKHGEGRTESLDRFFEDGHEVAAAGSAWMGWLQLKADESSRVDDALKKLEQHNERQANIIYLRAIVGLSVGEIAKVLGFGSETIRKEMTKAKSRLKLYLNDGIQ